MTREAMDSAVAVIDGRPELPREFGAASAELRRYVASECRSLLRDNRFLDSLPGYLPPDPSSQQRTVLVLDRMEALGRPRA